MSRNHTMLPRMDGRRHMSDQIPPTTYSDGSQWQSQQQPGAVPPQENPYGSAYYPPSGNYAPPAGGYTPPGAYASPTGAYIPPQQISEPGSTMALVGLILAIVGIVSFWIPFFGLPVPIVGIILSALGRRSISRRTMATVGLVIAIIATALALCDSAFTVWIFYQAANTHTSSY